MNNIKRSLSLFLLGAVLFGAPTIVHAQAAADPIATPQETRDAETAARAQERAAQNEQRADQLERYRDKEEDKNADRHFKNDVFMILNRSIQQGLDADRTAKQRADQAIKYEGYCRTDSTGKRVCTRGVQDQKAVDAVEQSRDILRDYQTEVMGGDCPTDSRGMRLKDANGKTIPCAGGTVREEALGASEVRKDIRETKQDAAKKFYDERNAAAKADAVKRRAGSGTADEARTIGEAVINFGKNLVNFPALFYLLSYVCGVYFMAMGLVKANRTAMEPSRNPVSDSVKYICAGVFLAALPVTTDVIHNSLGFQSGSVLELNYTEGLKGASGTAADGGAAGIDHFMINLVKDVTTPLLTITALIAFAAGVFMLFQGLQRLTKGTQEGPKGPAGLGTIMNFVVGAALISFVPTLELIMTSVFGTSNVVTYPDMSAIAGKIGAKDIDLGQAQAVITALLAFLGIIGVISFARGLFMMKDVADGSQNASLMGSMSHMIAGVCCVNFGAFANLLQTTLNLQNFGIVFN